MLYSVLKRPPLLCGHIHYIFDPLTFRHDSRSVIRTSLDLDSPDKSQTQATVRRDNTLYQPKMKYLLLASSNETGKAVHGDVGAMLARVARAGLTARASTPSLSFGKLCLSQCCCHSHRVSNQQYLLDGIH